MHQLCAAYSSGVPLTPNGSQPKKIEANQCKSKQIETIRFSGVPLAPAVCRLLDSTPGTKLYISVAIHCPQQKNTAISIILSVARIASMAACSHVSETTLSSSGVTTLHRQHLAEPVDNCVVGRSSALAGYDSVEVATRLSCNGLLISVGDFVLGRSGSGGTGCERFVHVGTSVATLRRHTAA